MAAAAIATVARMERDKDHLLTKSDGDYLRERLGEMVEIEGQRDAFKKAFLKADGDCLRAFAQREDLRLERDRLAERVKVLEAEAGQGVTEAEALAAGRALHDNVLGTIAWDDLRQCEQDDAIRDATIIVEAALAVRGTG